VLGKEGCSLVVGTYGRENKARTYRCSKPLALSLLHAISFIESLDLLIHLFYDHVIQQIALHVGAYYIHITQPVYEVEVVETIYLIDHPKHKTKCALERH
jgi:hypothetical protein